jgi:very-short-patch-repair endonuclease
MNNHYNKVLRDRARALRNASVSKAEKFLWKRLLSRKQLGVSFKRQRPIGNYIVDFFASEIQMIIEIDGNSHANKGDYDSIRHEWLKRQGYTIVRFSEGDVLNDFDSVRVRLSHAVYCLRDE